MLACPYVNGQNTLCEIMSRVPEGSRFFKFDNATQTWQGSIYRPSSNECEWQPNLTLMPGEGGFLQSPTPAVVVLSGELRTPALPVVIPADRCYLLSRQSDQVGDYASIAGTPPPDGARFIRWNAATSSYEAFYYHQEDGGFWDPFDTDPAIAPAVPPCTAAWICPYPNVNIPGQPEGPTISYQPRSCTNGSGSDATFTVQASGSSPLSYRWYFNGAPIPGATEAEYKRLAVQVEDAGRYSVVVSNLVGLVTSQEATLTVISLPTTNLIRDFGFTGDQFGFSLSNDLHQMVVIQASTNLQDWSSLETNASGAGYLFFSDPQPQIFKARYYRAKYLP